MQQAKDYAEILDLKFAYATNGHTIIETNLLTGEESVVDTFPSPEELWNRLQAHLGFKEEVQRECYLTQVIPTDEKPLRYYQEIAVNRVIAAILTGKKRVLLNMATGTGKTNVAYHICQKLWNSKWNKKGDNSRPRILFLADRSILVDDPKDKTFAPFGDARWKIQGKASLGREMYFATYQAIAKDESKPGLYRDYPPDFFDLIIVDEAHRGSARDDSNWREILEYFSSAFQFGMTATPLNEENRNTYQYFGNSVYKYSLRQGIDDGFLAPYRLHRIVTDIDATGWRPTKDELDRYGRPIPDEEYSTSEYERVIAILARTEAIAKSICDFLRSTDPYDKTIVFCVDQEHADDMRRAINNNMLEYSRENPDYVVRVTSDEKEIGRGHLGRFQEPERRTPVVVTTSRLLTTGVDIPTCKNIVIVRLVGSMTEFKQIIGRGTRVRKEYGKYWFSILDYTGSASRLFADPEFDGDPIELPTETVIGEPVPLPLETTDPPPLPPDPMGDPDPDPPRRKFYVDGGSVVIAAHIVYELDSNGKRLRMVKFTDFAREKVRSLTSSAAELEAKWSSAEERAIILEALDNNGVTIESLVENTGQPDADPLDLLCHVAFNAPIRSRRERAERLRNGKQDFWETYKPEARTILNQILDKYVEYGNAQFQIPDILKVTPISESGNVMEIAEKFGGAEPLRDAVTKLQDLLYSEAA